MTAHRFLLRLALAAAHVFAWIFVFHYAYASSGDTLQALVAVVLAYALAQVIAVLATPYAAKQLRRGARLLLVRATLFASIAFGLLAAGIGGVLGSIDLAIVGFAAFMGLYRAWYWIPYSVQSRGRIHFAWWQEIILALAPAVAGLALAASPLSAVVLLAIASVLMLVSIAPLYTVQDTHEGFSFSYRQTFHELFAWQRRVPLSQAVCNGFEAAALLLLWPVIIFTLVGWSYATLGLVLSLTFAVTIIVRMLLKRFGWGVRSPVVHSALTLSAWVLRGTVAAPLAIIFVDTYYYAAGTPPRGVDARSFEQAADNHTFVDELTALKEMGQGIGRTLFALIVFFLATITTFPFVVLTMFALAALAAVSSILLTRMSARRVA